MVAPAVESRIEGVTVFSRGARVTRVAEIRPEGGALPPTIRVPGLPLAADDGSFRVRVEPLDGADSSRLPVARDLRVALDVPEDVADEKPPDERALDEARQEEARLDARIGLAKQDLERLEKLPVSPRPPGRKGEPPAESPTAARLALVEFVSQGTTRLAGEIQVLREKKREATEHRKELEDRLRRASSDRPVQPHTLRKTLVVGLGATGEAGSAGRLVIDYMVPGARWAPAYAVRLEPDGSAAEVAMRAMVCQRSGEDWEGVRLTLSTARPEQWADLPELTSLRIGRRQPVVAPLGWRPPPVGAEELYRDWDRAFTAFREEPLPRRLAALRAEDAMVAPDEEGEAITMDLEMAAAGSAEEATFEDLGAVLEEAEPMPASPPPAAAAVATAALAKGFGGPKVGGSDPRDGEIDFRAAAPLEAPRAPAVRARDDMLAYGTLRMPPARDPERGHLVVTDRLRLYLELFVEREIEIDLDPARAVAKATRRAEGAGQQVPPRHAVVQNDDGFDYSYVAETTADIPSDSHYHSIPLLARSSGAVIRHVVVPRESLDVFRVARFENPLPGPLLPGPADVYLGREFVVTTDVRATPASASVTLGLGVDESVKVSRNTSFREETTGLTRGSLTLAHEIAIDVQSHAPHPIALEVRERIPTTREDEKEIDVEMGQVWPAWDPWKPEPESGEEPLKGGQRWLVGLAPGEKQELRAYYRIRIPAKNELVGGNRRER